MDYAKRSRSTKSQPSLAPPRWLVFLSGLVVGAVFATVVPLASWLPSLDGAGGPAPAATVDAREGAPNGDEDSVGYTFHETFMQNEVPLIDELLVDDGPEAPPTRYIIQAGSFSRRSDADGMRAELILLGLPVYIRQIVVRGETRYRVLVGPIDSDLEKNRIQDTLAEANIEAIPLRVPKPQDTL